MKQDREVSDFRVSPYSVWRDNRWRYANPVRGQNSKNSEIDWNFDLGRDESIFSSAWLPLLDEFKAFVHSAIETPANGAPMAAGRLSRVSAALSELAAFLAETGIRSLSEVDSATSWDFVDWLAENYIERTRDTGRARKMVHSAMMRILEVLPLLWLQRPAMQALGHASLPEAPFDGLSPSSVVNEELNLRRSGRLKPIPDEVAFPVMNAAHWMCGTPAQDIIRLQNLALSDLQDGQGNRVSTPRQYQDARNTIMQFRFSKEQDRQEAWRPPVLARQQRISITGQHVALSAIQSLRHLITTVTSAACLSLQSQTGIRAHELCGLDDSSDTTATDPSCLTSRVTNDGLLECFYLQGRTSKRGPPREVEWLIGSRPNGSDFVPPSVVALRVLKALLAPWRELAGTNALILTFTAARGLPREASSIGRMTAYFLTYIQKTFVHEHVDLSHLTGSLREEFVVRHAIRGHRWRTTFAQNIYSFHAGLVPALRDHFKHMSDAITIGGYIGSEPSLLDTCDSTRTITTAQILLGYSLGSGPKVGGIGLLMDKFSDELKSAIAAEAGDSDQERAIEFVINNDLEIWNIHYGRCFMGLLPTKSACNDMKGVPNPIRRRPALEFRNPVVCAGCKVFAAYPEHLEFWKKRKEASERFLAAAKVVGNGALKELRVEQSRLRISAAFVKGLETA